MCYIASASIERCCYLKSTEEEDDPIYTPMADPSTRNSRTPAQEQADDEALGNPEPRGRVRGVSSRHTWKKMDSWQSDATSHHMRQRYKEGLIQKGRDEAVKDMIMGMIQEAFTSTDPRMELRMQMFLQAGVLPQQGQADVQGQMPPGTSQPLRYAADEIMEPNTWHAPSALWQDGEEDECGAGRGTAARP